MNSANGKAELSIKIEIMQKVMGSIYDTMQENKDKFSNPQSVLDVLFSILVMTNREVLSRILIGSNSTLHKKKVLKDFFRAVTEQVDKMIMENNKGKN